MRCLAAFALVLCAFAALSPSAAPSSTTAPAYPDHNDLSYYLDATASRHPIATAADWLTRRGHTLLQMQKVMGPLPDPSTKVPLDVRIVEDVQVGKLTRRKITFQTTPEQRVAAYLFLPLPVAGQKTPAVLCLHPTGAPGKQIVCGINGKPNRSYALELAERGYITLAPDYPTFGEYACDFKTPPGQSGTMRAIWDNIRAVDLLQSLPEVNGDRIAAIGHSLGGHNAIFTAVFEPRIKAIVSSCGFTAFHRYMKGNLAGWTSPRYMPRIATDYHNNPDEVPFDFPELIAALAPRPFFTNSPLHDDNFDLGGVKECLTAAAPIYKLLDASDNIQSTHPDSQHDFPDEARTQAYEFIDRHLRSK